MNNKILALAMWMGVILFAVDCSQTSKQITEIRRFPVDNLQGLISRSNVQIDKQISADGNGSLRITATEPKVIRLFEAGDVDIETHA